MTSYEPTSHETFRHDSLDSLAYDWSRVADPGTAPMWPLKVYLPATTDDVVRVVRDAAALGEDVIVRARGHSSNRLVTAQGGVVLLTERLNRIVEIDAADGTVTVQSGAALADVDVELARHGLGLPVVGDHDDITAGGFASVGGISPASHRFGMFVDTVTALEYVDWDATVHRCDRTTEPERLKRLLAGTGQYGIITSLTISVVAVAKYDTIVKNHLQLNTTLHGFLEHSGRMIRDPGEALMERGVWVDFPLPGGVRLRLGQFSSYYETSQRRAKSLWSRAANGSLQSLGYVAGRLPAGVDQAVKYLGMAGIMLSPRYASIKNVERFTDQVLDSTVGDPTRMLIALAPVEHYEDLFTTLFDTCVAEREASGALTFISVYVKAIRSDYLARGGDDRYCEIMLYFGVDPDKMTDAVLEALVERVDDAVIAHDAFRYMHSRTTTDPERRARIDPNTAYAPAAASAPDAAGEDGQAVVPEAAGRT